MVEGSQEKTNERRHLIMTYVNPPICPIEEMTSKPINPISFHVMKKKVRKKKVSTKSTKERIADKTVSLAERLEYQTHK